MVDLGDLGRASANMLKINMGLKEGESVLFVTDVPSVDIWMKTNQVVLSELVSRPLLVKEITELMVKEFPHNKIDFLSFPLTGSNGAEPPDEIAEKFLGYDVLMLMTSFSLSHTDARQNANERGARIASMPGFEAGMFAAGGPMAANYDRIGEESVRWAELLTNGNQVHVTSPFGTDLSFSISGRKGDADSGLYREKCSWGNLPAGEAYITPVEGTAQGKLVVPAGWYPGLKETMILTFVDGYVTSLTGGGEVGAEFIKTLDFTNPELKHRRNCAELGIGTNPNAVRTDNILEAEKIRGTIHIAIGDSKHMGGLTESDLHEDFVLTQPVVILDGKKIIG